MPTIDFEPVPLASSDDLFALYKVLRSRGWVGVGVAAGSVAGGDPNVVVETLSMHAAADASYDGVLGQDGVRRITASVGDMKVTMGSTVTVMIPEVYAATYGAPQ